MGQNQGSLPHQLYLEWQQDQQEPNIYVNLKTGEQAECHLANLRRSEQVIMRKRTQQCHKNICRILHYEPAEKTKTVKEETKFLVFTQRLFPLSEDAWIPINSALSILKGFRRLTSSYGTFRITSGMIKVNRNKDIKVWINESPIKSEIALSTENEKQMINDIGNICVQYDNKMPLLLRDCDGFNAAINSILQSITSSNVNLSYISNKAVKNQEKPHFLACSPSTANKNHFRSTKETEDNQIKPIIQNEINKQGIKKQPSVNIEVKPQNNFLLNVHTPKPPIYMDASGFDSKSLKSSGPKKIINEMNTFISEKSHFSNFSQQNNHVHKPIQVQLNSSQPEKTGETNRLYKPLEHRNLMDPNTSLLNGQTIPSYSRSHREADKFKEILHRQQATHTPNYQIENRFNARRINEPSFGQVEAEKAITKQTRTVANNEKSEANTSRQYQQSQSISVRRYPAHPANIQTANRDQSRTKTQQFYLQNCKNQTGYSPRFKTNYLPTAGGDGNQKSEMQKNTLSQSSIYIENKQKKGGNNCSVTPGKIKPAEANQEAKNEEKKFQKMKQAQKIKQEMSFLGIENSSSKVLANDKSARDLLIKKKVEQKNKKHEDLKCAISKLLKQ